jgi:hypothetical protein
VIEGRVYIHELIDICGNNRARYLHHITANWAPIGRAERGQLCFGAWGVVGSTGRWPQVVNLWEYESIDALAANFAVELASPSMQDPSLAEWWEVAESLRSGGRDRILVAPDWSPSVTELCAEGATGAAGYCHELVGCRPGSALELLESIRASALPAYAEAGLDLVGAFRRAMADDDEVVMVWSFRDWSTWSRFEQLVDGDSAVANWRVGIRPVVTSWERTLLVDAELAPLRTGRQPEISDRRPLGEI